MNVAQIEANLKELIENYEEHSFIYDLLLAYNTPKASVTRLQKGNLNLSKIPGEIVWKKKLFYKEAKGDDLKELLSNMSEDSRVSKQKLRFVVATDLSQLLALDTKTNEKLEIAIQYLPKRYDFFLPLAGMEKNQHHNENPADVKAAGQMAKLFLEIKKNNTTGTPEEVHNLNVFLSRLLFCYYAEDTGIFKDRVFTNSVSSHTQEDGSDVHTYLQRLFDVLNTPKKERNGLPEYLNEFEYVNGGLFREAVAVPAFTARARKLLIEIGELDWADINQTYLAL